MALYAHTPGFSDEWHGLLEHLQEVARRAGEFAEPWGGREIAYALGLAHDLGKADPRFQNYLIEAAKGNRITSCPHSAPGAVATQAALGGLILAILGHHGGMPNQADAKESLDRADKDTVAHAKQLWSTVDPHLDLRAGLPNWAKNKLSLEFFIRMNFSSLVDADWLDTEEHMKGYGRERKVGYEPLSDYQLKLVEHMGLFPKSESTVYKVRQEILQACRDSARNERGLFRLTVPTGGGKTLAGLSFALDHAVHNQQRRVIVAIPYTSIIDQTAAIFKKVFGEDAVVEHHSAATLEEDESRTQLAEQRQKWACENWECPLVVTTTVQLFESIFSNKPSRCRKLHNLANSVIILDEVQSLPVDKLGPIISALAELIANYGCSVVLCTATQPDYSAVAFEFAKSAQEIVPEYPRHFELLKRVDYEVIPQKWSTDKVAQELLSHDQGLVVLNTRASALAVARACGDRPSVLHLSTLQCGDHRKRVIAEVKRRLAEGEPVHLVSTQVIEAGVDLDFPFAMRAIGPLDRIIQTAGRCNREGKLPGAKCIVFELEGEVEPPGAYKTAVSVTKGILKRHDAALDSREAATEYWNLLFKVTETGSLEGSNDRAEIQQAREVFAFKRVAELFKMIEDKTCSVIIRNYAHADVAALIDDWPFRTPRGWARQLQPFTVGLYDKQIGGLQAAGKVSMHESGFWIYTGTYDEVFGLDPTEGDVADLIT